ncbi:MAG TPA: DUF2461 domain-containing protein [Spirochaetota bacterium]|nr:DUF2461 domain-containing protein [Spirochaetota bacterium]HPC42169.1 DUF2461 domain-containing protein [Spirochaetota bacterium]HPL17039.1 DUF2461 domain-containing protein [Spirochaetota bacterium]HQF09659.1 DUF2461 domain-containing protein [Spirochaetota bacterium]HQH98463.1 DUF2461 domain-containing protein [Spirochaetota bacterium]
MTSKFSGFPRECLAFYRDLAKNNAKQWFEQHRNEYEENVMVPARQFVTAMGEALSRRSPGIHADPRTDKSIFRIYRDVRFSRDKRPFKTNLALWFWEGRGPRMECSGYYFHLEPKTLMLGAGIYMFPKHMVKEYRDSVVHRTYGPGLDRAVKKVLEKGPYGLGGAFFKKVPRGYPADHANAEYLLYNGLWAGIEMPVPKELFSPELVPFCRRHYGNMAPVHEWLLNLTGRVS